METVIRPIQYGSGKRPDPTIPKVPKETVTIVSVFPLMAFNKNLNFGQFEIAGCPACERHNLAPCDDCDNYASLLVKARLEAIDHYDAADGSGRDLRPIAARDIADALLVESCLDRGVFIAAGEIPTHDELVNAREVFRTWAVREVAESDSAWSRRRRHDDLSELSHFACRYLKLKREWLSDTTTQVACKICGKAARAGAVLGECGHPIDWKRAAQAGLVTNALYQFAVNEGLLEALPEGEAPVDHPQPEPEKPIKRKYTRRNKSADAQG